MESGIVAPSSLRLTTSTGSTVYLPSLTSQTAASAVERITSRVPSNVNHEPPFISAVTGSTSSSDSKSHVLTIQISQEKAVIYREKPLFETTTKSKPIVGDKVPTKTVVSVCDPYEDFASPTLVQSVQIQKMVQKQSADLEVTKTPSTYLYYMMPSGQCSPSDTMDSGTCSDMENTPPPLPKKLSASKTKEQNNGNTKHHQQLQQQQKNHRIQQRNNGHSRCESFTDDSEESESSLSYDSLSTDMIVNNVSSNPPPPPPAPLKGIILSGVPKINGLPDSLLRDIRDRSTKLITSDYNSNSSDDIHSEIDDFAKVKIKCIKSSSLSSGSDSPINDNGEGDVPLSDSLKNFLSEEYENTKNYENDKFYNFHINERVAEVFDDCNGTNNDHSGKNGGSVCKDDESFVGYRDVRSGTSTIRSSKGTVRGVKNRVRNGIATFLQLQQTNIKSYKEKDAGKVVLYTTSMGIVRETYAKCANVKQILRTLLVKFEERDVFMSIEYQQEIKDRFQSQVIQIPQLFVDGQHIGDSDQVERLNESGELRQMLKLYKSLTTTFTCQVCGGYRLLPCPSCKGSKKSVHRNHFTTEFVALKCMNCDEVGLVKCYNC